MNRTYSDWFGNFVIICFIFFQALDGILTYIGVKELGTYTEGNPVIFQLITSVGPVSTLTGSKLLASFFGIVLYLGKAYWSLFALTVAYGIFAIYPWVDLLFFHTT